MLNLPFLSDTNRDGTTGRDGWTGLSRCCDTAPIRSRPSDWLVRNPPARSQADKSGARHKADPKPSQTQPPAGRPTHHENPKRGVNFEA